MLSLKDYLLCKCHVCDVAIGEPHKKFCSVGNNIFRGGNSMIRSPCIGCIRKNENKNDYSCTACKARCDFILATQGDEDAYNRYLAFDYTNLGAFVAVPKRKPAGSHRGRKIVDEEYYQRQYYPAVAVKVKEKFGIEFKTIKEILVFLYDTYKSQKYIADNFFEASVTVIRNMLIFFEIKTLNMNDIKKMEYPIGKKNVKEK